MTWIGERTSEELDEQRGKAIDEAGKWPGMSYTDGVQATIDWIFGDRDEGPMDD